MDITFSKLELPKSGTVVFSIGEDLQLSELAAQLDKDTEGGITHAIESAEFKGRKGKCLSILGNVGELDRVVLLGTGGDEDDNAIKTEMDVQILGDSLYSFLNHARAHQATLVLEATIGGFSPDFVAANIAYGATLKSYRFDKYFTKQKDEDKPAFHKLSIAIGSKAEAKTKYDSLKAIADGVSFARDLVSEPPNILYPDSYAEICKDLKTLGVKVEVLGEKEMRKLGMGSLLSVGQGSDKESRLVVMQWNGGSKNTAAKPIAFVGKGVTFDTGGISLKPGANMGDMKYDMAGSAAVAGLMKALAGRKARVNAVGVIGLAENMPSSKASRPSDVITSMSGQTIEILNTDAEGRLVLADALWYTQDRFKPSFMVNLATLTGAIVVALGLHRAGLFSNNDELADRLFKAGESTGEKLWRFPLGKEYDKQIDSKIADVQNISNGKGAGSITAAQFLQRFINYTPWAHLDIAGMAWAEKSADLTPEGASGFGVRLLDRMVADHYES